MEPAIGLDKLALLRDAVRSTEARHSQLLAAFIKGLPEAANEVSSLGGWFWGVALACWAVLCAGSFCRCVGVCVCFC